MIAIEIIFWCCALVVFYTYIGYGIVLYIAVKIKELTHKPKQLELLNPPPEITLLIAAYNEQSVVTQKMANCMELDYPTSHLKIVWVTDGSTDATVEMLQKYPQVRIIHNPRRAGKAAAFNHAMETIRTPLVVFTDANTMLNAEAITEIARQFTNPKVGCVAGEKRVGGAASAAAGAATTEGLYWKYESLLKSLDYRLYSTVGAAGELFAIRTELYEILPSNTLLDDFMLSMRIAQRGYKIAYCQGAYACEGSSANMHEESKRKVRIAAGGLQSIYRLRELLNIVRYGTLSFQYISHRVLRWSVTPVALLAMIPFNICLVAMHSSMIYSYLLALQLMFYGAAAGGWYLSSQGKRNKLLYVAYYFIFMNINVMRGAFYLQKHKGSGTWEKAKRG